MGEGLAHSMHARFLRRGTTARPLDFTVQSLRDEVAQAARTDQPALIRGEPGTGKNLIARFLHFTGSASGPFP